MGDTPNRIDSFSQDAKELWDSGAVGDLLIWQPSICLSISDRVERVGKRDCCVIIRAEQGTAKETLARQIHAHSGRAKAAFIPVNCGMLCGKLLDSQLFGQLRN